MARSKGRIQSRINKDVNTNEQKDVKTLTDKIIYHI